MKRTIITPADPGGAALAALKRWLGISTGGEDAALLQLLGAAIDLCEAHTGLVPLAVTAEETHAAHGGWTCLAARPVHGIVGVDALAGDGTRQPLAPTAYELELEADGTGRFRIRTPAAGRRIVMRFVAGLAPEWDALPDALAQGIVRLAAQQYHARDAAAAGTDRSPPASVAALWQPWRRLRVA